MIITELDRQTRNELFSELETVMGRKIDFIKWDLEFDKQQDRFDDIEVYDFYLDIKVFLSEENPNAKYPRKESITYSYHLETYDKDNPLDCSIYAYNSDFGALKVNIDVDKVVSALNNYVDNMLSYQDENFINKFDVFVK